MIWRAVLVILGVLAGTAHAKGLTIYCDRALDSAWLVAEVEVVKVEVGAWMAWGGRPGYVRIRVTSDPSRIYRGWKHLGETYDVKPTDWGAQTCTGTLMHRQGSLDRILLVVDSRRVITLTGEAEGDGYLLRGWCDNDDCRLKISSAFDGEIVMRNRAERLSVTRAALLDRYRAPRQAFWARVTRFLDRERPALGGEEVRRWIAELQATRPARRQRTHHFLVAHAQLHVKTLRAAEIASSDPEVRRRLARILSSLEAHVEAYDVANRLADSPLDARTFVAREGAAVLTGSALTRAVAYVRALEAYAAEDRRRR